MKFTKTAVAVAIAGIAATPMIASADTTLAGVVEINLNGTDADGDDLEVGTGDVLFGITSEHELNSGLTGYGSLRVDLDRLSNEGAVDISTGNVDEEEDVTIGSVGTADAVYVGIKGGFGDFRLGEIPLAVEYGQVANDIFDVGGEISGGLSYVGTFGPVGIVGNFSPEGNQDAVGFGAKFGIAGFSVGVGVEERNELTNFSIGGSFAYAGASIAAHYWTQEDGDAAIAADAANGILPVAADDAESFSVKVGYGFAGVTAALTFSLLEGDRADREADQEAVRLDLGYALGGGTLLSGRITSETDDRANTDLVSYRIQLAKSF